MQYKLKKETKWKKYPGKKKIKLQVSKYDFRLLSEDKSKILVPSGNYKKVLKRFRQIEFFKHRG
ncbi:hypothetical protein HY449_01600 [Candidatus Pacearchaeota archaeon]|nr:hypothetical protein [Candidatus Pacearchaeota archaeon]